MRTFSEDLSFLKVRNDSGHLTENSWSAHRWIPAYAGIVDVQNFDDKNQSWCVSSIECLFQHGHHFCLCYKNQSLLFSVRASMLSTRHHLCSSKSMGIISMIFLALQLKHPESGGTQKQTLILINTKNGSILLKAFNKHSMDEFTQSNVHTVLSSKF